MIRADSMAQALSESTATTNSRWSRSEITSIFVTVGLAVALGIVVGLSFHFHPKEQSAWLLCLAASLGGLGGLLHEFAQSGGKILFFERKQDGLYMGSLAGVVIGAGAALLAIRGYLMNSTLTVDLTQIIYDSLMAGLGLKGLIEAVSGQALPLSPTPNDVRNTGLAAPPPSVPT